MINRYHLLPPTVPPIPRSQIARIQLALREKGIEQKELRETETEISIFYYYLLRSKQFSKSLKAGAIAEFGICYVFLKNVNTILILWNMSHSWNYHYTYTSLF